MKNCEKIVFLFLFEFEYYIIMDNSFAVKSKKVTWGDIVIREYFLDEGEKLGTRKVQSLKLPRVVKVPNEYKDVVSSVCGADVLCQVHITPKQVVKSEYSDLMAALGMA